MKELSSWQKQHMTLWQKIYASNEPRTLLGSKTHKIATYSTYLAIIINFLVYFFLPLESYPGFIDRVVFWGFEAIPAARSMTLSSYTLQGYLPYVYGFSFLLSIPMFVLGVFLVNRSDYLKKAETPATRFRYFLKVCGGLLFIVVFLWVFLFGSYVSDSTGRDRLLFDSKVVSSICLGIMPYMSYVIGGCFHFFGRWFYFCFFTRA